MKIVYDQIPPTAPYVVIDYEGFGMDVKRLHRPHGKFACCTFTVKKDGEYFVYLITDSKLLQPVMDSIQDAVWVASNLPFDLTQLRRFATIQPRKKVYCIENLERILYANYYDRFSVKNMARRYLGLVMDKETVKDFQDATELTPELIQYAATDGEIEYRIFEEQLKVVQKNKWAFDVWKNIDMPAMWAILDFQGMRVDVSAWEQIYLDNQAKTDQLYEQFPFNPNSQPQFLDYLRKNGFPRIPSTGKKVLPKWIKKHPDTDAAKMAIMMGDYRTFKKRASTYGMNFIKDFLEDGDIIYPDFTLNGTITGRMSSRLHNIPARETPVYRKAFVPRLGNKMIVGDWSAQEPREQAYLSGDENLNGIFQRGLDVYCGTYELMYGELIEKSDPRRSSRAKPSFLGATYLQTPYGFEENYGIPLDEGEDLLNRFWKAFPKSYQWVEQQKQRRDYVETIRGRRMHLNQYSSQCERWAVNQPHQGSGADMLKIAIAAMHQDWNFDAPFPIVHLVHDEIVSDVPEKIAREVAEFQQYHMVKAGEDMCPGVPFVAGASIVNSWYEGK